MFVTVNAIFGPRLPTARVPKSWLGGLIERAAVPPTPLSVELALPPGMAVAVSVAVRAPLWVGLKAICRTHEAPIGRLSPLQPFAKFWNDEAFGPLMDIASTPVGAPPVFVTVNAIFGPRVPTARVPKSWLGGLIERAAVPPMRVPHVIVTEPSAP